MILEVKDARVEFKSPGGIIRALDGVSLSVEPGETLAVVGESGCGKTTLARAVLGLQPLRAGSIELEGTHVTGPTRDQAKRVGMVWQDPYASLDPRWTVGRSIVEAAVLAGVEAQAEDIFDEVGLDRGWLNRFPHQLSGGQRQRVAIGRAIAPRPPLVICDEPTAALDLSIRAQILNMLKELQKRSNCSYLYISHDLLTVRFLADRIAVMYLGKIVEMGPSEDVFQHPKHPYTKALLESAPTLDKLRELPEALPGEIPDPRMQFQGCPFAGRCPHLAELRATQSELLCETVPPEPKDLQRLVRCHYPLA